MNAPHQTRFDRTRLRLGIILILGALLAALFVPTGARGQSATIIHKADNSLSLDSNGTLSGNNSYIELPTTINNADELIFNGTVESFNAFVSVGAGVSLGSIVVQNPQGAVFITANPNNALAALTLGNSTVGAFPTGGGIDMTNTTVSLTITAPVVLANSLQFTTSSLGSINISGNISGSAGITIAKPASGSPGTVLLSGTNTFTGGIILNAGTLFLNGASSAGTGTLVLNLGVLDNNSGGGEVLNNAVQIGTGGNINSGNFTFDTSPAANSMVFNAGVTLAFNGVVTTTSSNSSYGGSGNLTFNGSTGPGTLTLAGGNVNALVLVGNNSFGTANSNGTSLIITSGQVRIGSNGSITGLPNAPGYVGAPGYVTGNISDAGTLQFNEPANFTITNAQGGTTATGVGITGLSGVAGVISGGGGLAQISNNGNAILTLGAAETYTGTTTINNGATVQFGYFGASAGTPSAFGSVGFPETSTTPAPSSLPNRAISPTSGPFPPPAPPAR